MNDKALRKIVIVGGGTAGWMAAAPLAQRFAAATRNRCEVVVVESATIGTIGVGEATLPPIRFYNRSLGLDGVEFIRRTQATFKLGIEFKNWGSIGARFFHGFGDFGPAIENRGAWMHWLRLSQLGAIESYEDWSMSSVMARRHRFVPPQDEASLAFGAWSYAFHFDAALYADYLREYAVQRGAQRVIGTITQVRQRAVDGFVEALILEDGRRIDGDLFIDCSGFQGLLIEKTLKAGYEDWSSMLPCNSALAVPTARGGTLSPFTTSTAHQAGWQWRIPLQHRTGNGHVYSNAFMSDDEATSVLLKGLDMAALDSPRQIRFTTGRRRKAWIKNVVAVGLSAGFIEPLESTSIQFIMDAVGRLIQYLPDRDFQPALAEEFNRCNAIQFESVRDFIVLHYKITQRSDSEFWRYCAAMPIPSSLEQQIELFRASGRVAIRDPNGFAEPSWISLFLGLGIRPETIDPFVEKMDTVALRAHLDRIRQAISDGVNQMPSHTEFIRRYAAATTA